MRPIETRPSLADEAARLIREEIFSGRMRAGELLVESRLAAEMQISRAPVREALALLRAEGLICEESNGRSYVVSLTEEDIREIYGVRVAIEMRAARLIVRRRNEDDLDALRRLVERLELAVADGDMRALYEADVEFHTTVAKLSGNGHLLEIFTRSVPRLRPLIRVDDELAYRALVDVRQEHRALIEAIESGDEETAVRAFERHIEEGGEHVLSQLQAVNKPDTHRRSGSH